MNRNLSNNSAGRIISHTLLAALSLFINGFGIHLTIRAGIGVSPWDVFNLGLSKTLGILYGNASIAVSLIILLIDIILREPIGIAMFIDAIVVGKSVDFFNYLDMIHTPGTLTGSIAMVFVGLFIIGYTQYLYMLPSLGCGPRDTLLVGLKRHLQGIPIGAISIVILSLATFIGYLLGGPVGIGTLICAFCSGPIMQFAFHTMHFDATAIEHQRIADTIKVLLARPQ